MRQILFKAKRKNNGEWVEGYYVSHIVEGEMVHHFLLTGEADLVETKDDELILNFYWKEIDPNTICQYTGLTNKNGQKIWENDILRYSYDYDGSPFLKDGEEIKYRVGAVFWSEWRGSWAVCGRGNKKCTNNDVFKYNRNPNRAEVIGNIFDNADLLEVE